MKLYVAVHMSEIIILMASSAGLFNVVQWSVSKNLMFKQAVETLVRIAGAGAYTHHKYQFKMV